MKMFRKRWLGQGLSIVLAATMLAACSNGGQTSNTAAGNEATAKIYYSNKRLSRLLSQSKVRTAFYFFIKSNLFRAFPLFPSK